MENSIFDILKPVLLEAYRRRIWVITGFAVINLLALGLGLNWPKLYESYTTVFVQERNILGRLMEGAAVQTGVEDRVRIAREIIYGRRLMSAVLKQTGQIGDDIDPKALEARIMDMRMRTRISNVGGRNANLIKISYTSEEPDLAFKTTQYLAENFIAESSSEKERESQSAFSFVDSQVREYERKLKISEEELKEFRAANEAVTPGAEADVRARINRLRTQISENEQLLREATIKERSLERQIAGESDSAVTISEGEQYRIRKAELQQRLDALRLNYLETYPDIIALKAQIADLDQLIEEAERGARSGGRGAVMGVTESTVAQQLKSELYNTRTAIQTLRSRLQEFKAELSDAQLDAKAIPDAEAQLSELTREYEVTKGIYEDLLRRREIARVSMNLDLEKQGLTLRIDEPAFYPYLPTGPRLWHFVAGGILLGAMIPFGLIFLMQLLQPKVRLLPQIPEQTGLPVLGSIPHLATPKELRRAQVTDIAMASMLVVTLAVVAVLAILRIQGAI